MPKMVFQDTTREDLASLQVTPTWFGADFLHDTTQLEIAIHLPPGVTADEVLHQGAAYDDLALFQGRVVAVWRWPGATLTGPHEVGVSFPKRAMDHVVRIDNLELLGRWFEANDQARAISFLALATLFGIAFRRFTGGTGGCLGLFLIGAIFVHAAEAPRVHFFGWPLWILAFVGIETLVRRRRRRYLPAIATTEGGGIKRGLTAPEAAVVLELPLGKVLTLALFGLLKKGVLVQTDADPLSVEPARAFAIPSPRPLEARQRFWREAAEKAGVVLHAYEMDLLEDLVGSHGKPVHEVVFSRGLERLVKGAVQRMSGFDLDETRQYYERIVSRAWSEAESLGEVEARQEAVDRNLEWMMIDEHFERGFGRLAGRGYHHQPVWVRRSAGGTPSAGGPARGTPAPSFADVAGSFAGWAEHQASRVASALTPGSVGLAAGGASGKGIVDLSGFDRVTKDFFQAMASSSGGGGGGGGGCACACAGCACACACAGGGR